MLKKYPNRRIYDTKTGYMTVEKLRPRLLNGEQVKTKGGDDVTAQCLLNVIRNDMAAGAGPNADAMRGFIRSYTALRSAAAAQAT